MGSDNENETSETTAGGTAVVEHDTGSESVPALVGEHDNVSESVPDRAGKRGTISQSCYVKSDGKS